MRAACWFVSVMGMSLLSSGGDRQTGSVDATMRGPDRGGQHLRRALLAVEAGEIAGIGDAAVAGGARPPGLPGELGVARGCVPRVEDVFQLVGLGQQDGEHGSMLAAAATPRVRVGPSSHPRSVRVGRFAKTG